jgi:hypothetical protein
VVWLEVCDSAEEPKEVTREPPAQLTRVDTPCFSTGAEEIFVEITDLIFTKLLQVHTYNTLHTSAAQYKSLCWQHMSSLIDTSVQTWTIIHVCARLRDKDHKMIALLVVAQK